MAHSTAGATHRPGRPRDARVHQAILDATLQLLIEVGFEGMSIEGVAARAGVGKTTIYRRWASKEELVTDLVNQIHTEAPVVDTGSLRGDLLTLAHSAERGSPRMAIEQLMPRFLAEASANPALFRAYQESVIAPRVRLLTQLVERAMERGELRADLDPTVVVDLLAGGLMWRQLISGHLFPTSPDFVERLIDTLWRGIAARPEDTSI